MSHRLSARTLHLVENLPGPAATGDHRTRSKWRRVAFSILLAFLAGLLLGLLAHDMGGTGAPRHPVWKSFPLNSR